MWEADSLEGEHSGPMDPLEVNKYQKSFLGLVKYFLHFLDFQTFSVMNQNYFLSLIYQKTL